MGALAISDEDRVEFTPRTIEELATILESAELDKAAREHLIQGATMRGTKRYQLGYTLPLLATYVRLMERAIYDVVHEHMLSLNLSYFMFDLKRLNDTLGLQLEFTQMAFLNVEQRIGRRAEQQD